MFKLEFETDNAAFTEESGGDLQAETFRILRDVAERINAGELAGHARDINGNTVGSFELTED